MVSLNFAGKNDWHRPTKDELAGLYNDVGGSLWDARGWPTHLNYWSATVNGSDYSSVALYNGLFSSGNPSQGLYASCVSNP